jgi:hypothetical protein
LRLFIPLLLVPFALFAASSADLLIPPDMPSPAPFERKTSISPATLQADIEILISTMRTGYGGYRILANQLENEIFPALRALRMPGASTGQVCTAVGKILDRIPDNHIGVQYRNANGYCGKTSSRAGQVGANIMQGQHGPWSYFEKSTAGYTIPVLAITRMELSNSSGWQGLLDKAREIYRSAPALILDLRGNGGGDDSKPMELARILYGIDQQNIRLKAPSRIFRRQTPEAFALFSNSFSFMLLADRFRGRPERPDVRAMYDKFLADYGRAVRGELRAEQIEISRTVPLDPSRMFRGPIRILVDAGCASSCENAVEFFERHINAKTVGENTGGYMHFGNVGTLWLRNLGLFIGLPTHAEVFDDQRFVEKVGYAPAIRVQPGQDAIDIAIEDIRKTLLNGTN